jgi:hypothetical protein
MRLALAALLMLAAHTWGNALRDPENPTLCEGTYSQAKDMTAGESGFSPVDRWRMNELPDGNYSIDIQRRPLSEPFRTDERHIFSRAMEPLSADINLHLGAKVHCDYSSQEIACTLSGPNADPISSRLSQPKPYVFSPIILPLADGPWLGQMIIVQAKRIVGHKTKVALLTMLSSNDDDREDHAGLKLEDAATVEYVGMETIEIVGQRVNALKFRMRDSDNADLGDSTILWMSKSGFLLQLSSDQKVFTKLSSYRGPAL